MVDSLPRNSVINPLECFLGIESHVALDGNLGPEYKNKSLRLIPGDLYSACTHRLFHTVPGLLETALSNSYPNACVPFLYGLWYDPAGT